MKTCKKCIMNDSIAGVVINEDGICNYCRDYVPHVPYGEDKLSYILDKAKKKGRIYDALVPLSGGKDSTYVLYLAVKKYNLKVLTYTFNNGFMSELAIKNIERSVKASGVDHIWVKHDTRLIHELSRTALLQSGEICGICGIGIVRSMLKISEAWKIPLILLGHAPNEQNSFTEENIYDQTRLKVILEENKSITAEMMRRFMIYPKLNFISTYLYTKLGRFGQRINMLYYGHHPVEKEIGKILVDNMDWVDSDRSEYTRHFDCMAEPFTNFIREKRFGVSRRLPQLSNMIRNNEITREKALEIFNEDQKNPLPYNYDFVMSTLNLTENNIKEIENLPDKTYSDKGSMANKIFAFARGIVKGKGD